jgi:hypothetical protein
MFETLQPSLHESTTVPIRVSYALLFRDLRSQFLSLNRGCL